MPSSPPDTRPVVVGADIPMVGRERELGLLRRAYSEAVEGGQVRVVNLIGDPGVGKTRLLDELGGWIDRRTDGTFVLGGRPAPEGRSMPRSGMRALVARRFEIRDDDVSATVADKLTRGFGSLGAARAEIVGHWLGFDLSSSPAVRDLAGNPQFGTIALGHLTAHFRTLLTRAPLVLLLDDLQWSDPESLDIAGHVVDAFRDAPVLVVCATTPALFEQRPNWSAGPREATTTIDLLPLDAEHRRRHARELLHHAAGAPPDMVDRVAERAGGSPLHAEELVALLAEVGVSGLEPIDVGGVIRARLDALSSDESAVLRHAATVGGVFWDDSLVAAANASGAGPDTHGAIAMILARLADRGIVRQHAWSGFTGCREYSFRHPLLRAEAERRSAPAERAPVHRAVALWLERRSGDRVGENVGVLAEHLSEAGELERAADLLHEAGARAAETGALQSAVGCYRRSLDHRDATGSGHGIAATSTRIELAHLLAVTGRNDEARSMYEEAEVDATRSTSLRLAAHAMAGALRTAAARGDWNEAERLVERARPLAERFGGEVLGRFLSGQALLLIDGPHQDLATAQRLLEQALAIWRELGEPAAELRALNELGLLNSKAGRPSDADRWYEHGLALAARVGDTSGEWMLLGNRAVLAHLEARAGRADYGRVLELYRSSLDRRRRLGLPSALSLANLAQAEVEAGDVEAGRRDAEEALRTGWARHDPLDWTIAMITFAQLAFVDGRRSDGLAIIAAIRAERRTPSLDREIGAVLDYHGVDRDDLERAATAAPDLAALVDQLLADEA